MFQRILIAVLITALSVAVLRTSPVADSQDVASVTIRSLDSLRDVPAFADLEGAEMYLQQVASGYSFGGTAGHSMEISGRLTRLQHESQGEVVETASVTVFTNYYRDVRNVGLTLVLMPDGAHLWVEDVHVFP